MRESLVIGTRGSPLARCQARIVQAALQERFPQRVLTVEPITVQADRNPELPLAALGGEGVFVKELEAALLDGRIHLAVHSMKDLPLSLPPELCIAAVLKRDEPRDAFLSRSGATFERLPIGSKVGTSSLRRRSQMLRRRRDLEMLEIRGNVDTRLRKLAEGRYDAIVLAACGLIRLGLEARITEYCDVRWMLPEPGQGALAIETREDDPRTREMAAHLEDAASRACVEAERAFLKALGGGCRVPIAAYASCLKGTLALEGAVIAEDGRAQVRGTLEGPMAEPVPLGERLATRLTTQGARQLLRP